MKTLNMMENILIYLLQVNILLSFLYLGYYLFLKGLTFYKLNRIYFLLGTSYALIFPFLNLDSWLSNEIPLASPGFAEYITIPLTEELVSSFTLANAFVVFIAVGIALFFIKLFTHLLSLARIHYYSSNSRWEQYLYRNVIFPVVPFSFFNKIYLHKKHHNDQELTTIFKHERVHIKGFHSVDVLFFEMLLVFCWYNPFVWPMRKAVRQNLEYLTDQQMLNKGVDRQKYQYSLLNVSQQGVSIDISNQFNFKILKKRIIMMNKKKSSKLALSKYVLLLPVLIIAGASFTIKKTEKNLVNIVDRAQETQLNEFLFPVASKHQNPLTLQKDTVKSKRITIDQIESKKTSQVADKPLIILDGKTMNDNNFNVNSIDPNSIESINVIKDKSAVDTYGDKGKNGVIVITSKNKNGQNTAVNKDTISAGTKDTTFVIVGKKVTIEETEYNDEIERNLRGLSNGKEPLILDGKERLYIMDRKERLIIMDGKERLIIVDGKEVPNDVLSQLKPADILSISVLKDESAISAYGDKGKNGVILISTKSSEKSDSEINQ